MAAVLQRMTYGWSVLFVGTLTLTGVFLALAPRPVLFSQTQAMIGVAAVTVIGAAVLRCGPGWMIQEAMAGSLAVGLVLVLAVLASGARLPMQRYALVRHVDMDGLVQSDEVYHWWAPPVREVESAGGRASRSGGKVYVERYMYSARFGLILGNTLGTGPGSPDITYEADGLPAWLFGLRAGCEQFTFLGIHTSPILLVYGLYCNWKRKALASSLRVDRVRSLFLLAPFVLGLSPLLRA